MLPRILPLIVAVTFTLAGAVNVLSQTSLELLDRAQKDLQTRYDAAQAKKAAAPEKQDANPGSPEVEEAQARRGSSEAESLRYG